MRAVALLPIALLCQAVLGAAAGDGSGNRIEGVRVGQEPGRFRVVLDLAQAPHFDSDAATAGDALTVLLAVDQEELAVDPGLLWGSPVAAIDSATAGEGRLALTFRLLQPALGIEVFPQGRYHDFGHRLVIDFFQHDPAAPSPPAAPLAEAATEARAATAVAVAPAARVSGGLSSRAPSTAWPDSSSAGAPPPRAPFSGTWEHEWAIAEGGNQKFETRLSPRLDLPLNDQLSLVAEGLLRLDGVGELGPAEAWPDNYGPLTGPWHNSEYAGLLLRELYLDLSLDSSFWRIGKQQVVWGEADGLKVLDVVNPQSFREYLLDDFEDSRIPLWTVNGELPLGDLGSLQLLWIPDRSYHEFAEPGTPFALSSPLLVPTLPPGVPVQPLPLQRPDDWLADSDAGGRLLTHLGGWDLTFNYLYHYHDAPAYYLRPGGADGLLLEPEYRRTHTVGGSASNVFGKFTLRGELVYDSDTYVPSTDLARQGVFDTAAYQAVLGLDWQPVPDLLLSSQWFVSYLEDYDRAVVRGRDQQVASLFLQSDLRNRTWRVSLLGLYALERGDSQWQARLRYWMRSELALWLGVDLFDGDRDGLFGQFDAQDRLLLGLEYGF